MSNEEKRKLDKNRLYNWYNSIDNCYRVNGKNI